MIQKRGETYYIVADPPQNVVYVGGPNQYQAYQQLRAQKQLAEENLETLSYIMMHHGKTTNETNATKLKRKKT